jgi:hypothetical protein
MTRSSGLLAPLARRHPWVSGIPRGYLPRAERNWCCTSAGVRPRSHSAVSSTQPVNVAAPEDAAPEVSTEDLAEMEKMLEEVRGTLKDLEERLEKMETR